jgi:hypothetical protein
MGRPPPTLAQQSGIWDDSAIRGSSSSKPSGREWARQLGISHTWLQKLVRKFTADSKEMRRLQAANGDPRFAELTRAREYTQRMRERGELRPSGRAKLIEAYLKSLE